ncbi:MAG: T9SS type A sorting domain-containing protein [Paludibacteraceae bacterium]|nr:T9SS type A sorting domain-containing protein [Paludibacteraceae bacterium]
MNFRCLLLSGFVTIASLGSSFASSFIGISADGSKEEFQIGKVQSIKFEPQKSGDKGFPTIVFNANTDGVDNVSSSTVAVLVYPNPVSEYITVSGIEDGDEVIVRGIDGNVFSRTTGNRVDVSGLATGNYILTVKNQSVKFIKK